MAILLVTYDLTQPDDRYLSLRTALEQYPHIRALSSTWLIDTFRGLAEVRDELSDMLADVQHDRIFVVKLHKVWASYCLEPLAQWLREPDRSWSD